MQEAVSALSSDAAGATTEKRTNEKTAGSTADLASFLLSAQVHQCYNRFQAMSPWNRVSTIAHSALVRPSMSDVAAGIAAPQDVVITAYPYNYARAMSPAIPIPQFDTGFYLPLGEALAAVEKAEASDDDSSQEEPEEIDLSQPLTDRSSLADAVVYSLNRNVGDPSTTLDLLPVFAALAEEVPYTGPDDAGEGEDVDSQISDEDDPDTVGGSDAAAAAGEEERDYEGGGDDEAIVMGIAKDGKLSTNPDRAKSGPQARTALDAVQPLMGMVPADTGRAVENVCIAHMQTLRQSNAIAGDISKRDVMAVLSDAANDAQALAAAYHGKAALASFATGSAAASLYHTEPDPGTSDPSLPSWGIRQEILSRIPVLDFESRFETGNLCAANRIGPLEYELSLDIDTNTGGHTQWFFFRVQGMVCGDGSITHLGPRNTFHVERVTDLSDLSGIRPGKPPGSDGSGDNGPLLSYKLLNSENEPPSFEYRFHICNLEKGGSSFNEGMRPLVYFQTSHGYAGKAKATYVPPANSGLAGVAPTLPGDGWRRSGVNVVYYRNQYCRMKGKQISPLCQDDDEPMIPAVSGVPVKSAVVKPADAPKASQQYSETWTVTFPPGTHTAFFAYCFPYTFTDLRRDIVRWEKRAIRCARSADANVPIREWDAEAATEDVDGLGAEHLELNDLVLLRADEQVWLSPAKAMDVRPSHSTGPQYPLGTSFAGGVMHRTILCHTITGNPVPLLTITDFASGAAAMACRPYIVLSARVHPGETNGSWMMRGVIDFLTSTAPVAVELRKRVIFKVVPFLNPDGVINGHHRTNLAGLDLNRHWTSPDPSKAPTIWHLRKMILALQMRAAGCSYLSENLSSTPLAMEDLCAQDLGPVIEQVLGRYTQQQQQPTRSSASAAACPPRPSAVPILPPLPQPVLLYCDLHGHSRKNDVFVFGCHELTRGGAAPVPGELPGEPKPDGPMTRLFPKLLSARIDTFSYAGSSYRVQRDKYNCARVALWRDACLGHSYTMEASFSGPQIGSRAGSHFTTWQYEEVGHAFCMALLDWVEGPSGERYSECLSRIQTAVSSSSAGVGGTSTRAALRSRSTTGNTTVEAKSSSRSKTRKRSKSVGSRTAISKSVGKHQ
jgi:hypothetical protein